MAISARLDTFPARFGLRCQGRGPFPRGRATRYATRYNHPRAKTTTYTYDDLNRLTSETDPRSEVRSYAYDAASRLTSRTDPLSQEVEYTYNDRNQLTIVDYPTDSDVSFAYNDAGLRTSMTDATGTTTYAYDDLYRLTSVTFPGSRTVGYTYDAAGRRTEIVYPNSAGTVTYGYDDANRLTSVTDWDSNVITYGYDDANRMTAKTLPTGTGIVSAYTYDDADRLTGISHVKGGTTTLASVAYTLDDVGNRTQRVDQQGTHTYAYDDLYRLTSVTYPGPSTTEYTFDAFGNRETMTDGSGTTDYSYDDADRLVEVDAPAASPETWTWDDNGNLTDRGADEFAWDEADRMTSATVDSATTTFAYRGDGLRHSRTTGAGTTTFTWDVNAGLPVVLYDGSNYLYGGGLEAMEQGGAWYYYLEDGLGSTMAVADDTGAVQNSYTYDVYGTPTVSGSLPNEYDFAGQATDASTGLQYLRARYMDPGTGVFLSRDPLAGLPGWTANPFAYSSGNPANWTDPTGLCDDGSPTCLGTEEPIPPAPDGWRFGGYLGLRGDVALTWFEYYESGIGIYVRECKLIEEKGRLDRRCGPEYSLDDIRRAELRRDALSLLDYIEGLVTLAGTHKLGDSRSRCVAERHGASSVERFKADLLNQSNLAGVGKYDLHIDEATKKGVLVDKQSRTAIDGTDFDLRGC